jgi:hypothetical protein
VTSDYQRDLARLERLLSGDSELGRSRVAWEEADRLAGQIAARGGVVQFPEEIRSWLLDEPLRDEELERLASRPLHMQALPAKVRRWVEGSIVVMRKRQEQEKRSR